MGNNPVMMVDPDGEIAFVPALIVIAKAAAIGAGIGGAKYGISTAVTGQSWNWGDFGRNVAMGAATGAISGGIGLGVSSGLSSLGVSSGAANFIGGFAGNFAAGSFANGGIPTDPTQLTLLTGTSLIAGANYSNPLSSATPAADPAAGGIPNFGPDAIVLPDVQIEALWLGNYPPWWGMTNLFLNSITRSTSLSGFYNGSYDRFANMFFDNQTELRWMQMGGDQYVPYDHVNYIGGTAPAPGVRSSFQKAKYLKDLANSGKTPKWMNQWLQKGKVPPGHHVDHIKPLSIGGADKPFNMRLQNILNHRTHHRFYRPWIRR